MPSSQELVRASVFFFLSPEEGVFRGFSGQSSLLGFFPQYIGHHEAHQWKRNLPQSSFLSLASSSPGNMGFAFVEEHQWLLAKSFL